MTKIDILIPETINIGSFNKIEKRIRIKATSKRKSHYRRIKGAKDKVAEVKIIETPKIKNINIKNKMIQYFGKNIINEYNNKLSNMNNSELHLEFKDILEKDEKFTKYAIGSWGHMMSNCDGWATEILALNKSTSMQDWETDKYVSSQGKDETWMKSILLNQEYLKRKHPDGFIDLYRGLGPQSYDEAIEKGAKTGDIIQIPTYNLSSWSEYPETGEAYARMKKRGIIVKIKVPIENILWTTRIIGDKLHHMIATKVGIKDGRECVVIGGGDMTIKIHTIKEYDHSWTSEEIDKMKENIHRKEGLI